MKIASLFALALCVTSIVSACGDDSSPADTGTADTGTADTGTGDTGTADTGTADTGTGDTGTADTGTADSAVADGSADGASDGGGTVTFCMAADGCNAGQRCNQANVTCGSEMGFCVATAAATCAGFAGTMCPSGMECMVEATSCGGADISGVCVTPAERAEICATQPSLWNCG